MSVSTDYWTQTAVQQHLADLRAEAANERLARVAVQANRESRSGSGTTGRTPVAGLAHRVRSAFHRPAHA